MEVGKSILGYGLCAFCVSFLITLLMMLINVKDVPGERSSHRVVTPKCGGIGMIGGLFITILAAYGMQTLTDAPNKALLILLSGAFLMGVIGFIDDLKTLSWRIRFLSQSILSGAILLSGFSFKTLPFPWGVVDLGFWGSVLTFLWLIGLINAFNFMDGINGLSGGVTVIACLFLLPAIRGDSVLLFSLGILAFSSLGFLVLNFPKGKIFLGDVGSQFLGFFFACLGVILPSYEPHISPLCVPLLFFIYIFDTLFTFFYRLKQRKNVFESHCDHLYQRLVRSGFSHVQVASLYFVFFGIQGFCTWKMMESPPHYHLFFFLVLGIVYTLFAVGTFKYAHWKGIR